MSETNVEGSVQNLATRFKGSGFIIQGRNPMIENWKSVWIGKPDWLNYNVYLPDGSIDKREMLSINPCRFLSREWANNYANENTMVKVSNNDYTLQKIFDDNRFFGKFNNFVEEFMGIGIGLTLERCSNWVVDKNDNVVGSDNNIKIQCVRGDRVYPINVEDGEVTEVAVVTYSTNGIKLIAFIKNEAGMYDLIEIKGEGKNGSYTMKEDTLNVIHLNTDIPMFQCWMPNITNDDEAQVGTSMMSKARDAFHQIDMVYNNFYGEIDLGKKIKYLKESQAYDYDMNGNKVLRHMNMNDETVIITQGSVNDEDDLKTYTDSLRVQEFISTMNFHLNVAAMLCGLGSTEFEFGEGGRPLQTATAVIAKESKLGKNIIKQENFATAQFKKMVKAIAYLNDNFTNNPKFGESYEVTVTYSDNIIEDNTSKKENDMKEVQAGIKTPAEYRAAWNGEDIDEATKFLQENGLLVSKYLDALQIGAMTPEQYVKLVYGDTVENKEAVIQYITEKLSSSVEMTDMSYNDETTEEEDEEEGAE